MIKTLIPDWLEPFVLRTATLKFEGVTYEYAIVRTDFSETAGCPEMFTTYSEGLLAVSDAYPDKIREIGLIHEIIEDPDRSTDKHDCVNTLKRELEMAKEQGLDIPEYTRFRTQFFDDMVLYYEKKERTEKEDFILAKLRYSQRHLHLLLE
ncbi:hypothetical protein N9L18_01305 [Candidatus Pacebacteria bacterium]|nr:hypothetical protein [Candidatus Paceibacterota bacterium]